MPQRPAGATPRLLAGGNPQIPKGDGDGPVRAYLDAMPGWKAPLGRRLDALIAEAVPDARRGVRWNQPMYGSATGGWFVSFRCFTRYVKVTFFQGALLTVPPPVTFADPAARGLDLYEGDVLDADAFRAWCVQAAARPGWTP